ncbi:MAG: hypothetical protein A3J28_01920 [Acidobacteria bacterium RIFCSPLOWO2_12_FULL_60_22]|nr:MAG: hypothetical protein A3J28_01920 [Acidobacteria bacterium RIFCSPLOWO2_12_FULL_60_22]
MKVRTITLVLAMFVVCVSLHAQQDPLMGTWKLNLSKSKYNPGPPPRSRILKFEPSPNDGLIMTNDGITANGEKTHTVESFAQDGKDHPETEIQGVDARVSRRIDAYTTETINKKGGQTVQVLRRIVSKDGKTLTITVKGKTATGATLDDVRVLDKQ